MLRPSIDVRPEHGRTSRTTALSNKCYEQAAGCSATSGHAWMRSSGTL